MPESDHLQGLAAGEVVLPGGIVDVQLLAGGGVVVVHVLGDVQIHPIQLVYQGHKALGVHQNVVVNGNTEGVLDLLLQGVRTGAVEGRVDLAVFGPGALNRCIPGDGDHPHLLLDRVVLGHDDGVGVAPVHILAQEDEIIDPLPADQGVGVLRVCYGDCCTARGIRSLRLRNGRGLDQQRMGNI